MVKRLLVAGSGAVAAGLGIAVWRSIRKIDLAGRVVLITGGSRGLGLALAREFAARGSDLVLCARSAEELDRARRDLAPARRRVSTVVCDVADPQQAARAVSSAISEMGRLDILVNNAGVIASGPLHTMTVEDFEEAMNVMFWGTVHTTLAALPHFRQRKSGAVVNITSVGGKVSVPHLLPYCCAKFAAVAFSEGLRADLGGTGIKVTTVVPGLMRTGSHVNARFKGAERGEPAWFSAGASLPGISISARRAARQIVSAVELGRAEAVIGAPARALVPFHGLFPELSLSLLSLAARLLPSGSQRTEIGKDSPILQRPWMRALTVLGRRAAETYLQPSAT